MESSAEVFESAQNEVNLALGIEQGMSARVVCLLMWPRNRLVTPPQGIINRPLGLAPTSMLV